MGRKALKSPGSGKQRVINSTKVPSAAGPLRPALEQPRLGSQRRGPKSAKVPGNGIIGSGKAPKSLTQLGRCALLLNNPDSGRSGVGRKALKSLATASSAVGKRQSP
jgi:hypothetical protein